MWGMSLRSPSLARSLSSRLSPPLAQLGPAGKPDGVPWRRFHGSWWLEALDRLPTTLAGESLGPNMEPAANQNLPVTFEFRVLYTVPLQCHPFFYAIIYFMGFYSIRAGPNSLMYVLLLHVKVAVAWRFIITVNIYANFCLHILWLFAWHCMLALWQQTKDSSAGELNVWLAFVLCQLCIRFNWQLGAKESFKMFNKCAFVSLNVPVGGGVKGFHFILH